MKLAKSIRTSEILIQAIQEGRQPFFQITSNSMAPLFHVGDDIQIARFEDDELKKGDILVLEDETGMLAHRLWLLFNKEDVRYLLLRGDRLRYFDPPFPVSQIIGRAIARRRKNYVLDLTKGLGFSLNKILFNLEALAIPIPKNPAHIHTVDHDKLEVNGSFGRLVPRFRVSFLKYVARLLTIFVDLIIFTRMAKRSKV